MHRGLEAALKGDRYCPIEAGSLNARGPDGYLIGRNNKSAANAILNDRFNDRPGGRNVTADDDGFWKYAVHQIADSFAQIFGRDLQRFERHVIVLVGERDEVL